MDWASGIRIENGRLVGEVVRSTGEVETVSLGELSKRGVPKPSKTVVRRAVTTQFATWKRVDAMEYLEATGLPEIARHGGRHTVFEFESAGKRHLVPALVLMRALFRPNRYVLPAMFHAQALDHLCHLTSGGPEPGVQLIANWHTGKRNYNQKIMEGVFAWMSSYPSARAAISGVHEEALRGCIDMQLPAARVKVTISGLTTRSAFYVTELTIFFVEPQEDALPAFTGGPEKVPFRVGSSADLRAVKMHASIPVRRDGTVALTDAEWAVVSPILLAHFGTGYAVFDQKDLFDGLLEKLGLGHAWRTANYRSGNWSAAYQAYRTWTKRGTFDAAVTKLRSLRQQDS